MWLHHGVENTGLIAPFKSFLDRFFGPDMKAFEALHFFPICQSARGKGFDIDPESDLTADPTVAVECPRGSIFVWFHLFGLLVEKAGK